MYVSGVTLGITLVNNEDNVSHTTHMCLLKLNRPIYQLRGQTCDASKKCVKEASLIFLITGFIPRKENELKSMNSRFKFKAPTHQQLA